MSLNRSARCLLASAVLTVAAVAIAGVYGQDETNAIVSKVKASVKDPAKPFTMVVQFKAKDGAGKKIEAAFAKAVPPSRREKGCLAYDLNRDGEQPMQYLLYERWQNLAALEAHLKSPHIRTLLGELGELLAGPPEIRVLLPAGDAGKRQP